jgi:hypothetical protein
MCFSGMGMGLGMEETSVSQRRRVVEGWLECWSSRVVCLKDNPFGGGIDVGAAFLVKR